MEKVRFGILGCGFIGRVHINQIIAQDDAEVVAVFDPSEALAKQAAEMSGGLAITTAEELISLQEVDVVVVASPNKTHADLAIKALEAGKHLISEKPLALSGKQAKKIAAAAEKAGTVTMVPHQMRWAGSSKKVKELADKGEFGNIYYGKAAWLRQCGIPGWGSWFTRFDESGGGPLIDIGVHMLDLSLYLMGNPKPVSVYGSTYAEFGPRKMGTGTWGTPEWDGVYDVEDLASALIKMDNGATLLLEVSWAANIPNEVSKPHVILLGSEGGASVVPGGKELELAGLKFGQSFSCKANVPELDMRVEMMRHFLDCVKAGEQTIAPVYSGMVNNIILDAIYESAKTGKSVDISWD
jgi:predicted dehydrogenase